jgi:phage-related holin
MTFSDLNYALTRLFSQIEVKTLAGIGTGIAAYLVPSDTAQALYIGAGLLLALDTVTGIWASVLTKKPIKSAKLARLGTKFVGYGSVVIVSAVATNALPAAKGMQEIAVCSVLGFVLATEGLSVLENVAKMGLPVPKRIKDALRGAKDEVV